MKRNKNRIVNRPPASPPLRKKLGIPILSSGEVLTLDQVNRTVEQVRREREAEILGNKVR